MLVRNIGTGISTHEEYTAYEEKGVLQGSNNRRSDKKETLRKRTKMKKKNFGIGVKPREIKPLEESISRGGGGKWSQTQQKKN